VGDIEILKYSLSTAKHNLSAKRDHNMEVLKELVGCASTLFNRACSTGKTIICSLTLNLHSTFCKIYRIYFKLVIMLGVILEKQKCSQSLQKLNINATPILDKITQND